MINPRSNRDIREDLVAISKEEASHSWLATSELAIPKSYASIDPGISTGIAVVTITEISGSKIHLRANLDLMETVTMEKAIQLAFSRKFSKILIERMPSKIDIELLAGYTDFLKLKENYDCSMILPGSWKPMAKANKWKHSEAKTDHEQDAYNMLRWWLLKEKNIDIGELKW